MSDAYAKARHELDRWREAVPDNFYTSNEGLKTSLRFWLGEAATAEHEERLALAGYDAANDLDRWARETNRDENLPIHRAYDGNGNRVEDVVFHPDYHDMGRSMYGSGVMALFTRPGQDVLQMALFYLFAHNGEAGHNCPLACTAGAIKLISTAGDEALKSRLLPRLLNPDYDTHLHASQFLTEVQGGSDVGANAARAVQGEDGQWRLYGEKWFCSVIDAPLWVLTARPDGAPQGTKGLTTFVAERHNPDGSPNGFSIRRLKTKVGTRSMASAEVDLNGMRATPIGEAGEGFKHVVNIVLNTSRLFNAFAAAGSVRRAYLEARAYARTRKAFGHPISDFPLIRRSLARLRTESAAQLATGFHSARLAAAIAEGKADKNEQLGFRFLVNGHKYWTSIRATMAVREAIEVLGGNGTIEDFSVLPRLYRDAIVIESWEGTHNVLAQQILRDMARYGAHTPILHHARQKAETLATERLRAAGERLNARLGELEGMADELLAMPLDTAQLHVRSFIERAMAALQGVDLLREAAFEREIGVDTGKARLLEYHIQTVVDPRDAFGDDALMALEAELLEA